MTWEPMEVIGTKKSQSGQDLCYVIWRPPKATTLCKGWISQEDLIQIGFNHLLESFNEMNKKREIPVVEINSSFIPRHSKESFQYELNKESGLISLQLSPDNEYPLRSFRYIRDFCYREGTSAPDPSFLVGCSCPSKCESSSCFCISTNHSSKAPYINHCLNTEDFSMVECNLKCACGPSCPNRVAQKGVQIKIVLKYIKNKGWSVFANQNVSKGAFITEYLGELLTQTEAKKREEKLIEKKMPLFLFDMDFYDADLNHGSTTENQLLSIDAQNFGNISRFFNHSCSPNLFTKPVFYDSAVNSVFTRIAFFASKNIKKGEELCFDYEGVHGLKETPSKRNKSNSKKNTPKKAKTSNATDASDFKNHPFRFICQCGSSNCRGTVF